MLNIKIEKLDIVTDLFKNISNKLKNLEDSIPIIQNKLSESSSKIKVEISTGVDSFPKIPYANKQRNQIKKYIEADYIIPIPKPQKYTNKNKTKVKTNKVKTKNISKILFIWLTSLNG
jgi:hypothetical protein